MEDELVIPSHVPDGPRAIIEACLKKDPDIRPTSQEILQSPWVQ